MIEMSWFLRVQDGEKFRDVAVLAEGESVIVGRAQTADIAFPHDDEMSSRHASLTIRGDQCLFADLHSTNGTFLNGEPAVEGALVPGATLQCGLTILSVESGQNPIQSPLPASTRIESPKSATATAPTKAPPQQQTSAVLPEELSLTKGFVSESASEIIQRFQLKDQLALVPDDGETPQQFSKRLHASGEPNDCLTFLAYALPKRLGVWWAINCLRSEDGLLGPEDPPIVSAIMDWIVEPSDVSRREAMTLAEANGMQTAAAWAAVTAFWSHGSMGPKEQPEVPAGDELAGKALSGAVILASVSQSPENASKRRTEFLELAMEVAAEEIPLPA